MTMHTSHAARQIGNAPSKKKKKLKQSILKLIRNFIQLWQEYPRSFRDTEAAKLDSFWGQKM